MSAPDNAAQNTLCQLTSHLGSLKFLGRRLKPDMEESPQA